MRESRAENLSESAVEKFLRDEAGSITVEFLLWLPVFIFVLAAVVDASSLFQVHADMQTVARDSARRMAMDEMDADAAQSYALNSLAAVAPYTFAATAQGVGTGTHSFSVVTISVPIAEVSVFSFFSELLYGDAMAAASMRNRVFPT